MKSVPLSSNPVQPPSFPGTLATTAKKCLLLGAMGLLPLASMATPPQDSWRSMAQADGGFVNDWIAHQSILAVYPSPDQFASRLADARRVFETEALRVNTYEGYRQALNHFVGSFQDRHLRIAFSLSPNTINWPGFFAVYRGGKYFLSSPQAGGPDQAITECDGRPISDWVRQIATYEQMTYDLESTNAKAAPLIFRDGGSPFIRRPENCNIAGKDVHLEWQAIAASTFATNVANATGFSDRVTAASNFGANGAWVRMGLFSPKTQIEGKAFKQLIAGAGALRSKSVIVLDVRGNSGGPYEWFMGFLRALYGDDYVNYYARARLQIAEVYRTTPAILQYFNSENTAEIGDLLPPSDGMSPDQGDINYAAALKAGKPVFMLPANARQIPMPAKAPASAVKGKVYVLTDYSCGSACIAFVDELKKIPGVEQIGVETFIDSRPGTPFGASLPSGNGIVSVPIMTRDGRERGDNIPQKPAHVFMGNMADTAAIRAWVESGFVAK